MTMPTYPRYPYGWRHNRGGEIYALSAPTGTNHSLYHAGDLLIGRVYRHKANPRRWVAEDLSGYWVPQDGRTLSEAGNALYKSYLAGVSRPFGWS
jgi:hypothetical protein